MKAPTTEPAPVPSGRRPGRPRDAGANQAILTAVAELLAEGGFGALTIDAVAARAGVGKATIYRRWDGKERLVLDALAAQRDDVPMPDTGSLRGDLRALFSKLGSTFSQGIVGRLMPALAAEAAVNPAMRTQLRDFVAERREPARAVFERAIERHELPADADVDLLIDSIVGPAFYRLFFTGAPMTPVVIGRTIDLVIRGAQG